jgi:hypothetical protein
VPPFVGVAVNVTAVPLQTGFADAAMETTAVRLLLTVTVLTVNREGHPFVPV